jgi:nicotinate phosphoribosyltransferase
MQNASFFFAKMKNYLYLCGIKIKMKNDMKNIVDQVAKIFDKNIVRSILDSDLYKFSMQYWVIQHYPEAEAEYTFSNRDKSMIFDESAVNEILHQIKLMSKLRLTDNEYDWMKNNLPFLPVSYLQYLSAYRFNPSQVNITLLENGELNIKIKGKYRDSILWEVPLMSIISEVYFKYMNIDWSMDGQVELARSKAKTLSDAGCLFADFSSRRRRNFETQDIVVREMKNFKGFVGTSNPYLAMMYNVKAIGTCAHEAIGATAALESLNHPNKFFMESWAETYKGSLGTMLPDTYGLNSFLNDFTLEKAKLWDGVRHDSGDPHLFTDKVIAHYNKLGIDPTTKTIIFSDGLNIDTALKIAEYCKGKIRFSFGIGTFFASDFKNVSNGEKNKPMNMVIKLTMINGVHVVKLSDSPGKAIGDPKMVEIMKYIHL